MKTITLTLRDHGPNRINLSRLRLDELVKRSEQEVCKRILSTPSGDVELGECFKVASRSNDDPTPTLVLQGDCQRVDAIGHQHRVGNIVVQSDAGEYCGSCMSGGSIRVSGNAGDHLGGASGSRGVGMNGGELFVGGDAGDFVGHRMRRGEIRVAGRVGDSLAAWQVAGTIRVGGEVGENVAYGMRRGTLVLNTPVQLPAIRFTNPVRLETPFQSLLMNQSINSSMHRSEWMVSRGDRSIGGIGEVWLKL